MTDDVDALIDATRAVFEAAEYLPWQRELIGSQSMRATYQRAKTALEIADRIAASRRPSSPAGANVVD